MRITVFFAPNTPITTDVQNLLTEYQYAGKGKIDIEHIDPERNLSRAKELFDKYKVVTRREPFGARLRGSQQDRLRRPEMAEFDQSGMAFGEGPRVAAFKGEQAITSAMMDLVEGKKKTAWLRHRSQGTAAFGRQQPDHRAENVYRKRKHQVSGAEPARSRCNSG